MNRFDFTSGNITPRVKRTTELKTILEGLDYLYDHYNEPELVAGLAEVIKNQLEFFIDGDKKTQSYAVIETALSSKVGVGIFATHLREQLK